MVLDIHLVAARVHGLAVRVDRDDAGGCGTHSLLVIGPAGDDRAHRDRVALGVPAQPVRAEGERHVARLVAEHVLAQVVALVEDDAAVQLDVPLHGLHRGVEQCALDEQPLAVRARLEILAAGHVGAHDLLAFAQVGLALLHGHVFQGLVGEYGFQVELEPERFLLRGGIALEFSGDFLRHHAPQVGADHHVHEETQFTEVHCGALVVAQPAGLRRPGIVGAVVHLAPAVRAGQLALERPYRVHGVADLAVTADALHQLLGGLRPQLALAVLDVGGQQPAGVVVHPALAFATEHHPVRVGILVDILDADLLPFIHVADFLDPLGAGARELVTVRCGRGHAVEFGARLAVGVQVHVVQRVGELAAHREEAACHLDTGCVAEVVGFLGLLVLDGELEQVQVLFVDVQVHNAAPGHERSRQAQVDAADAAAHGREDAVGEEVDRAPAGGLCLLVPDKAGGVHVAMLATAGGVIAPGRVEMGRVERREEDEFARFRVHPAVVAGPAGGVIGRGPVVLTHVADIARLGQGHAFFFQPGEDLLGEDGVAPQHLVQVRGGEAVEDLVFAQGEGVAVLFPGQVVGVAEQAGVLGAVAGLDPALGRDGRVLVARRLVGGAGALEEIFRLDPLVEIGKRDDPRRQPFLGECLAGLPGRVVGLVVGDKRHDPHERENEKGADECSGTHAGLLGAISVGVGPTRL